VSDERSPSGKAIAMLAPESAKMSPAARTEFILDLVLGLPHRDDDNNTIGRGPPLITREEAMILLKEQP
jgi:hypothetical protein